ncbi:DUF4224 domain-containing protein [Massilia antarctica]|uniref:DUF4224 domain-containing protein n=1 Tax=Massilia antarctica TaxID=2765360 RepID=UPI00226EC451|nr:DUF4224 domain-containing protein [Massilia sp. H27-R4]MCY0910915.1 DUF4224 domain-containing protein [Massilia sp. H27-R4]
MNDIEDVARLVAAIEASRPIVAFSTFLSTDEVSTLTGRKIKALQIQALRGMGMLFWVNAAGKPVVPRSAIDGRATAAAQKKKSWEPPE